MLSLIPRDQRKDKDGKVRKDDDWEEKRPRDKKGRMPPKGYSGSRRSRSISRSEESVLNLQQSLHAQNITYNAKKEEYRNLVMFNN